MAKTRTEVFIETSETFIIKRNRIFVRTWCEDCAREVGMVTLPEAALLSGHDVQALRSMMENRHIHFSYLKPEMPSVCLRSLLVLAINISKRMRRINKRVASKQKRV